MGSEAGGRGSPSGFSKKRLGKKNRDRIVKGGKNATSIDLGGGGIIRNKLCGQLANGFNI